MMGAAVPPPFRPEQPEGEPVAAKCPHSRPAGSKCPWCAKRQSMPPFRRQGGGLALPWKLEGDIVPDPR
jgi:hypothetical protein